MSAKKDSETKLREDEYADSGFVTGEISGPCDSNDIDSGMIDYDEKNSEGESGVKSITDRLSQVMVSVQSPAQSTADIPPLYLLFQQDEDGDTQLHIASVHGCEKSVGTLIRVCPEKSWLDVPNDYGHTPLHLAVMSGNAIITRMLVIAGADIGARDCLGETPLHKATAARHIECLKALLAKVPEHQSSKVLTVLEQKNYNGQSCVHLAASAGSVETMKTLIHYGAKIDDRERLAGWTALHTPRWYARRNAARHAFGPLRPDSDSDWDSDDDTNDSDNESLYEKIKESRSGSSINVA